MDWKEYRQQPDGDMYGKIMRRVKVRRLLRTGGMVAGVAAVAVVAAVLLNTPKQSPSVAHEVAVLTPQTAVEQPQSVVATPVADAAVVEKQQVSVPEHKSSVPTVVEEPEQGGGEVANAVAVASVEVEYITEEKETPAPVVAQAEVAAVQPVIEAEEGPAEVAQDLPAEEQHPVKASSATQEPRYVEGDALWVPNAIIPASDDDAVRQFSIRTAVTLSNFSMQIYNRRGMRVYVSNSPTFQWDATYNGSPVPQGAYVWVATYKAADGKLYMQKGTVTVIR